LIILKQCHLRKLFCPALMSSLVVLYSLSFFFVGTGAFAYRGHAFGLCTTSGELVLWRSSWPEDPSASSASILFHAYRSSRSSPLLLYAVEGVEELWVNQYARIVETRGPMLWADGPTVGGWYHAGFGLQWTLSGGAHPDNLAAAYIPAWSLLITFAVSYAALLVYRSHRRRLLNSVRCARCGYDLRASPSRCPECGTARSPLRRS
jgi:hypothetical protein